MKASKGSLPECFSLYNLANMILMYLDKPLEKEKQNNKILVYAYLTIA